MKLSGHPGLCPSCQAGSYSGAEPIHFPFNKLMLKGIRKGRSGEFVLELEHKKSGKEVTCVINSKKVKKSEKKERLFRWLEERRGNTLDKVCDTDIPFLKEDDLS